ncbi:MAG: DUF1887 family CARF protein [Desulfobia sp.]
MKDVQVCLISAQPIPNLVPLIFDQPEEAVFLVSPEMKGRSGRLGEVVKARGIKVREIEIPAYDFGEVSLVCDRLLSGTAQGDCSLTLNVTGGTKISALAAFQSFYFSEGNPRIIYLDSTSSRLMEISPQEKTRKISGNLVRLREYLASYGFRMTSSGKPAAGFGQRRPFLESLAQILIRDEALLGRFNSAVERGKTGAGYVNIDLSALGEKGDELAGVLEKCRAARRTGNNNLNIPSDEMIFFCGGGWLEEYVYQVVHSLGIKKADVSINVEGSWEGSGRKPTRNEFDLHFLWRNRLHLISCKTANLGRRDEGGTPGKEAIYELSSLRDRAGGLFGRSMLVSARKLAGHDRRRAENWGIEVVEGNRILQLRQHLRSWLGLKNQFGC